MYNKIYSYDAYDQYDEIEDPIYYLYHLPNIITYLIEYPINSTQFYEENEMQYDLQSNLYQNYHHNHYIPNSNINYENYDKNYEYQNNQNIENLNENYNPPKMTHLRGLVNIESTCYMNSILQCFSHITELCDYFKTPKMNQLAAKNISNKNKIYPVFQEVIINLWNTWDSSPYSPNNFKNRLGEMNPLFKGAYPNDAKDLLTFLLLNLHEELNKPKNNNINNNVVNINNQQNKEVMFKIFSQHFINNYRSIISGLFFGVINVHTICSFCNANYYNYQTFNFLIFPLEKVLEYKNSLTNYNSNFINSVTIEDCFRHYQLTSILNNYYCNKCKNQINCSYTNKISILPNIIIIILNRGKGLQYNVNISFDENIGLKDYVEYCKDESIYELIGLVTHYGESSASGHFMARCKSPIDGNWYLYNDQIVTKIGYFDKKTFAQGNPYILFYKKIKFKK